MTSCLDLHLEFPRCSETLMSVATSVDGIIVRSFSKASTNERLSLSIFVDETTPSSTTAMQVTRQASILAVFDDAHPLSKAWRTANCQSSNLRCRRADTSVGRSHFEMREINEAGAGACRLRFCFRERGQRNGSLCGQQQEGERLLQIQAGPLSLWLG